MYRNELGKTCFAHGAAYSDIKELTAISKRTISDTILKDRAYEIARNHTYCRYQRALASMVDKFFDKKTGSAISVNKQLAVELHKSEIKKFGKKKYMPHLKTIFWQQI